MLQPRIIDEEHYEIAQTVKQSLQCCKELQDVIAILGLDEISEFKSTPPLLFRTMGCFKSFHELSGTLIISLIVRVIVLIQSIIPNSGLIKRIVITCWRWW